MENTIKSIVAGLVRKQFETFLTKQIAEAMGTKLEDPEFSDELEMIVGSEVDNQMTLRKTPEPRYKTVVEFVDGFIRPMYPTTASKAERVNWSKQWYKHPEVVARMHTLWRTYELKRAENPNGFLEEFLRVNCDYHLRHIMAEEGVFSQCAVNDTASVPLPIIPAETTKERK